MICCVCGGIFLFLVLLGVGLWLAPLVAGPIGLLTILYLVWFVYQSCGDAEVHPADEAARILFEAQAGRTPELPEKLQGVFWMSDNAAPELLVTLDGSSFDPENYTIAISSGAPLNWTYSTGVLGWLYWAALRVSYLFCAKLYIQFDPEYRKADMPLYLCGCLWIPMGMVWKMSQIDENSWDRDIYLYCCPCMKWDFGSYVLKRVIDAKGRQLPAFKEMMSSIGEKERVKGLTKKPLMQIMNGRPGGGGCFGLLPGADRYELPSEEVSATITTDEDAGQVGEKSCAACAVQ